jgi:hypothetical protein
MSLTHRRYIQTIAATFLFAIFAVPQLVAQNHVVSPADLQKATVAASQTRQQNANTLMGAFSNPKVEKALKAAKLDPTEVKTAISSLSDTDLAQLASRTHAAQNDFAGGTLSDRDLIVILVAIAALILIIVAVR